MKHCKKVTSLLLAAALCLAATACGGADAESAVPAAADLSVYAGCWKYDTLPFYMVINEDNEWVAVNVYGDQIGPGQYTPEGDGITLCMNDGSLLTSFTPTDTGLADAAGNTLTAWDYILLLPNATDELNMTANFPDSFANVTIQYPVQMNVSTIPGIANALAFNAEMEAGTEDYYSNLFFGFEPISGYDDKMTQGLATAKPYMEQMLNQQLEAMYSGKILKTVASDCIDAGSYYSITGYVWLDPSVFEDAPASRCAALSKYGTTAPPGTRRYPWRPRWKAASRITTPSVPICWPHAAIPPIGPPRPSRCLPQPPPRRRPRRPQPRAARAVPIPAITARRITGTMPTATCGTGTARTMSSSAMATATISTMTASIMNPTTPVGRTTAMGTASTTKKNITRITTPGPTPATVGAITTITATTAMAGAIILIDA